jgi:hypothetical protein
VLVVYKKGLDLDSFFCELLNKQAWQGCKTKIAAIAGHSFDHAEKEGNE